MHPLPTWGFYQKLRFVLFYAWAKLRVVLDVRRPKFRFLIYELRYSFTNLFNTLFPRTLAKAYYSGPNLIATNLGVFEVRSGTQDAALISPAFEREDLELLWRVLNAELDSNTRVVFCDVGANIGHFAVRAGLKFRGRPLEILLFEPIPDNLILLKKNLYLNDLVGPSLKIFPYALSDESGTARMTFSREDAGDSQLVARAGEDTVEITTMTGDESLRSSLGSLSSECLVIKMDVEGHERAVLRGLEQTLKQTKKVWLCIEDIHERDELYQTAQDLGFEPVWKVSPYNSWWRKQN